MRAADCIKPNSSSVKSATSTTPTTTLTTYGTMTSKHKDYIMHSTATSHFTKLNRTQQSMVLYSNT